MADKRIVTVDYLNSEGLNKNYINNTFANALKDSKNGSAILIDDVSPVTHEMDVKVRGKNLCVDVSDRTDVFFSGSPTTTYSITGGQLIKGFAVNGNATNYHITDFVNSNGTVSFKTSNVNYTIGIDVIAVQGETYTVSANITGGTSGSNPIWTVFLKDGLFQSYTTAQSFTVPNNCNQAILLIRPSAANTECSFSNVQLELGTTATAYTPYVPDLTAVKVSRCGKNVLNPSLYLNTATFQGITYTTNGDTITLTGTAIVSSYVNIFSSNPDGVIPLPSILQNKKIKLYAYGNSYTVELLIRKTTGVGTVSANTNQSIDTTGATGFSIRCRFASGNTYNDSIKFMITEEGVENNTEYEPYIAPTEYTPAADGTVEGITSLYPNTTLMTDTEGVLINCEYNRDINKAFAELQQVIISLGGNV